jgi:hypothetical protein
MAPLKKSGRNTAFSGRTNPIDDCRVAVIDDSDVPVEFIKTRLSGDAVYHRAWTGLSPVFISDEDARRQSLPGKSPHFMHVLYRALRTNLSDCTFERLSQVDQRSRTYARVPRAASWIGDAMSNYLCDFSRLRHPSTRALATSPCRSVTFATPPYITIK